MNKIRQVIIEILIHSIEDVYQYDSANISDDVSEWNICARLAIYIEKRMHKYDTIYDQKIFEGYFADVEYNRSKDGLVKRVAGNNVRPDLLIHTREETRPNYLVLETKKKTNSKQREDDIIEIKRMVYPREEGTEDFYNCGTICGVFLDYNKNGYKGTIYWYNEKKQKVSEKPFTKESIKNGLLNTLFQ